MPTLRAFGATAFALLFGSVFACGTDEAAVIDGAPDGSTGDGSAGDGSALPDGAASGCPNYTTLCGGKCIPTAADPENCGGCGVRCTGNLACSAGTCSDTCPPTMTKCGNTCADLKTDDKHCGACGNPACPPGQGCVDGACHALVPVTGTGPANCPGGGAAAIDAGTSGCLGNIAQTVFRWALCSCKDAQFSGNYVIDAYDSSKGPYKPGGLGAGLGANENYGTSGTGELWGTMWIAGTGGVSPSSTHAIKTDLRSGGDLKPGGGFAIGKDAFVEGEVSGSALTITGTLTVPAGRSVGGGATYGSLVRQPVDVAPPCDFCRPEQAVPIAALVAAHRSPNNDNATINLDAGAFANPGGPLRLDLPCGRYYLSRITSSHHVAIVARAKTALYIDGEVSPNGLTLAVAPGAELDVFVGGSVGTSGVIRIGSTAYPAATRVYVAGTSGFAISDTVSIAGNIYVPNGSVQYSSQADQFGSIYAGNFATSKDLKIHYDRAIGNAGVDCNPTPRADGGPTGCGSCKDCGNQACINGTCGSCTDSAQCCPPLKCVNGGCQLDIR